MPADCGRMIELGPFQTSDPARFAVLATVRYEDLDPNRHVNHAKYLTYLEECRLALRRRLNAELKLPETLGWAVGALSIQYRRAILYPSSLKIETAPIQIGRTSFTLGYGIYDDNGCNALASTRSVCLNEEGRPTPLPDALRDWLTSRQT
jgi:acyl-CoA thioester hydrolase